jgi:hypothetical protein
MKCMTASTRRATTARRIVARCRIGAVLLMLAFSGEIRAQRPALTDSDRIDTFYFDRLCNPSLSPPEMMGRASRFVESEKRHFRKSGLRKEADGARLVARGSMRVPKRGGLGHRVEGEVEFELVFEAADSCITYRFTRFELRPFAVDRYGQANPKTGKKRSLDDIPDQWYRKQWEFNRQTTDEAVSKLILGLNQCLLGEAMQNTETDKL